MTRWKKLGSTRKRKKWFIPAQRYYKSKSYYNKRLAYLKRIGFKEVGDRIIDVGKKGKHYVKLKILRRGGQRISVGYVVQKRKK